MAMEYHNLFIFSVGRRQKVSLGDILKFVTGQDTEPLFGYHMQPSTHFRMVDDRHGFFPTSSTCLNTLYLPIGDNMPTGEELFEKFDQAFLSEYFGRI